MDMVGIPTDVGCSDTTDEAGGDTSGVSIVDGRDDCSTFASSTFGGSGLLAIGISGGWSGAFESMLALPTSFAALFSAGLSGRDPSSDDGLDSAPSLPLLTAFARRSCNREFGLLREELRETCAVSIDLFFTWYFHHVSAATHLVQPASAASRPLPWPPHLLPSTSRWPGHRR